MEGGGLGQLPPLQTPSPTLIFPGKVPGCGRCGGTIPQRRAQTPPPKGGMAKPPPKGNKFPVAEGWGVFPSGKAPRTGSARPRPRTRGPFPEGVFGLVPLRHPAHAGCRRGAAGNGVGKGGQFLDPPPDLTLPPATPPPIRPQRRGKIIFPPPKQTPLFFRRRGGALAFPLPRRGARGTRRRKPLGRVPASYRRNLGGPEFLLGGGLDCRSSQTGLARERPFGW
jgi:hypothetical protein